VGGLTNWGCNETKDTWGKSSAHGGSLKKKGGKKIEIQKGVGQRGQGKNGELKQEGRLGNTKKRGEGELKLAGPKKREGERSEAKN